MPRIGYVYPAGGRLGTSFQVVVGGQYLNGATNIHFSAKGVQATVLEYTRPLTQKEFNDLREKLKELQEKRLAAGKAGRKNGRRAIANSWTEADEKLLAEIRKKLANPPNRQGNPAIAEKVILRVTLPTVANPGQQELRLETPLGLSNPLVFQVGTLPEFSRPAGTASIQNQRPKLARFANQGATTERPEMLVSLPAVLNGQIMPGAVDRFRFSGRQGQHLVVTASARELIPYLPDAVPGWFQATLALCDANGKELQFDDDYRFHPDPVLHYVLPKDGVYILEIRDSIYRGREDFVYRITAGELPFITSIFPLGGRAGQAATVELKGWNLPADKITIEEESKIAGTTPVSVRKQEFISNRVPFSVDTLPERLEQEPNNAPGAAQTIAPDVIVNGRIDQPGDWDVFRFEGRAGDELVAEVYARRLDSPLDAVLKLTDSSGRQLAYNDDHEDKAAGLMTHHADSVLRFTLPETGAYFLQLGDAQRKGGAEYGYRLRVSAPRPDFELRTVPASLAVRAGASVALTVYALRKDGFSNEITLRIKDVPGFSLSGARIPANQDQVRLTLTAPPGPKRSYTVVLEGSSSADGQEVVRQAIPAEDMMQAFAYRHLVPAQELQVMVLGGLGRGAPRLLGDGPVKIPAGGTARVQISVPRGPLGVQTALELSEAPEGISIRNVSRSRDGAEIVFACDSAKAKRGLEGNLIINAFVERQLAGAGKARMPANKRPLATLPAIPFKIVPP